MQPIPATRKAAMELGAKKYNTGKPCAAGHMADRHTSSGACCACVQAASNSSRNQLNGGMVTIKAKVHPADAEAARAYIAALCLQRGIIPAVQPGRPTPAPGLVDIAAARATIFASVMPPAPPPLPDWVAR